MPASELRLTSLILRLWSGFVFIVVYVVVSLSFSHSRRALCNFPIMILTLSTKFQLYTSTNEMCLTMKWENGRKESDVGDLYVHILTWGYFWNILMFKILCEQGPWFTNVVSYWFIKFFLGNDFKTEIISKFLERSDFKTDIKKNTYCNPISPKLWFTRWIFTHFIMINMINFPVSFLDK